VEVCGQPLPGARGGHRAELVAGGDLAFQIARNETPEAEPQPRAA
jgi:hypothetical protein